MSLLKRLFGGAGGAASAPPEAQAVDYNGFRIIPEPINEGGQFRLAARIENADGSKSHHLIRADVIRDHDDAVEAAIAKARQMIDQLGERVFD